MRSAALTAAPSDPALDVRRFPSSGASHLKGRCREICPSDHALAHVRQRQALGDIGDAEHWHNVRVWR
jgi:hypothetical protein